MTPEQIVQAIRVAIREPSPVTVSDAMIEQWITDAVRALGIEIKRKDARFFTASAVLSSSSHVFALPSGCQTVMTVWDARNPAMEIEAASNATPIPLTITGHGLETGDTIMVYGVGGTTAANGTWRVTVTGDDTLTLDGSVGNAGYTSGGLAVRLPKENADRLRRLDPVPAAASTLDDDSRWFSRAQDIVVDDVAFQNALIVDFVSSPQEVTDIPAEYHGGLVAYPVINLIRIPSPDAPDYQDVVQQAAYYRGEWARVVDSIDRGLAFSSHQTFTPPQRGYMGAI